jgi:hypothetical protein
MASINLLPRKEFEITLDSGDVIKGKYSNWAVKRFCDKKKVTLKGLSTILGEDTATLDDVCQIILCAVEHTARETGRPFSYTDFHVCNWIEELGGFDSQNFLDLVKHGGSEIEEKKTESQLTGQNISESVIPQV